MDTAPPQDTIQLFLVEATETMFSFWLGASVVCCLCGALSFGMVLGFSGPTIDTMRNAVKDHNNEPVPVPSQSQLQIFDNPDSVLVSWFTAIVCLGALAGAYIAGHLIDWFGRKWTMVFNAVVFASGWLWIGFAPSVYHLLAARTVCGMGIGFVSTVIPVYLGEIATPGTRGKLGALKMVANATGVLSTYAAGMLTLTDAGVPATLPIFCDWRKLAFLQCTPAILYGLMAFCPESPRWLAMQGQTQQAHRSLRMLWPSLSDSELQQMVDEMGSVRGLEGAGVEAKQEECRVGGDENSLHQGLVDDTRREQRRSCAQQFWDIYTCRRQLWIGFFLLGLQQSTGVKAISAYKIHLPHITLGGGNDAIWQVSMFQAAGIRDHQLVAVIASVCPVAGCLLATLLVDRWGRRAILLISGSCMVVSSLTVAVLLQTGQLQERDENSTGWMAVVATCFYLFSYAFGVGPVPFLIQAELYPDKMRALGTSFCSASLWIVSFASLWSMQPLVQRIGYNGIFFLYSGLCSLYVILVYQFVPETQNRCLQDIQRYFEDGRWPEIESETAALEQYFKMDTCAGRQKSKTVSA